MGSGERKVQVLQKKLQALRLRCAGATYDEIAKQLGYASRSTAHYSVMAALKETLREPADKLRQLELERLNTLLLGVWNKARNGDPQAVMCALRVMERIEKLQGIEAPDKLEINARLDVSDLSDEDLVRVVNMLEEHATRHALPVPADQEDEQ